MTPTLSQLKTWFDAFNRTVFDGALPAVTLALSNTRTLLGQFQWGPKGPVIKVSRFYDRTEEQYRNTLLHEMCHLYCYAQGWVNEHHGPRWKKIAAEATARTGLVIQRCQDISGLAPSAGNEARLEAAKARRQAPSIIVDIDCGTYHFLVKVSRTVLAREVSGAGRFRHRMIGTLSGVYLCDAPLFTRWSSSRSLRRGYKYQPGRYESEIKPLLEAGARVI